MILYFTVRVNGSGRILKENAEKCHYFGKKLFPHKIFVYKKLDFLLNKCYNSIIM